MNRTHGKHGTSVYNRWRSMLSRCAYPANKCYEDYGGRGIKVCDRWRTFENFYADMGDPPAGTSIERLDLNGDYEPSNCVWATTHQQMRNRRNSAWIEFDGQRMILEDWAARIGISSTTLADRLAAWPLDQALTTPPRATKRRTRQLKEHA